MILFAVSLGGCNAVELRDSWSDTQVAETKRRGEIVCHAIDAYRTRNGKYPFQLSELQPKFIGEIPRPTVGYKEWHYDLIDNGRDYWLQVVASEFGPQLDRTSAEWSYIK